MTHHHAPQSPNSSDGPADGERNAPVVREIYEPIKHAAAKLRLTTEALRARCRRSQRRVNGAIVADLGAGIRAVKLGRTWRVRFPEAG